MPCGGIYPIKGSFVEGQASKNKAVTVCWQCSENGGDHWIEEWDSAIHGNCVPVFLMTAEGECIVSHGHEIYVQFKPRLADDQNA